METIQFRTTIGEDRIIRLPAQLEIPPGEMEVVLTPSAAVENQRLRSLVARLANAAAELDIDTAGLPRDLAENHDHYLHGLPKRTEKS